MPENRGLFGFIKSFFSGGGSNAESEYEALEVSREVSEHTSNITFATEEITIPSFPIRNMKELNYVLGAYQRCENIRKFAVNDFFDDKTCQMTLDQMKRFLKIFSTRPTIQEIGLPPTVIDSEISEILATTINQAQNFKHLKLQIANNDFSAEVLESSLNDASIEEFELIGAANPPMSLHYNDSLARLIDKISGPKLKTLKIKGLHINDELSPKIAKSLKKCTSLESVFLENLEMSPKSSTNIAEGLAEIDTLEGVHIKNNMGFGAKAANVFAEGKLNRDNQLRMINIKNANVGDQGFSALFDVAIKHQDRFSMGGFILSGCGLTDLSMNHIADRIKSNKVGPNDFVTFSATLHDNAITDEGVENVLRALSGSSANIALRLDRNNIDNPQYVNLARKSYTGRNLHVDPIGQQILEAAFGKNSEKPGPSKPESKGNLVDVRQTSPIGECIDIFQHLKEKDFERRHNTPEGFTDIFEELAQKAHYEVAQEVRETLYRKLTTVFNDTKGKIGSKYVKEIFDATVQKQAIRVKSMKEKDEGAQMKITVFDLVYPPVFK